MCSLLLRDPIGELGDRPPGSDGVDEPAEAAAFLRDGDREDRFTLLADLGSLGDEPQPIEVHVGAGGHRDIRLGSADVTGGILFHASDGKGTGRFEDRPGVREDVLDRRAHGVGVHGDDLVDELLNEPKGLDPD